MSYEVMTIHRDLFLRLLSHAPEALRQEADEKARRAIPALCFTEDDVRQKLSEREGWSDLSEDEQRDGITWMLHSGDYDHAGTEANLSIAMAAMNYVADIFLEKEQRQAGGEMTW